MEYNLSEKEITEARKKAEAFLMSKFQLSYFDAQDILQEALVKAYKNLSSFKNRSSFSTWYISIVKNEALSFFLKKKKTLEIEDGDNLLNNYSFAWTEPEIYIQRNEIYYKNILNKLINSLGEKHKTVLNLILEKSLSHKEVSKELKIPINSVRTRIFYAKKILKKTILNYAYDTES